MKNEIKIQEGGVENTFKKTLMRNLELMISLLGDHVDTKHKEALNCKRSDLSCIFVTVA